MTENPWLSVIMPTYNGSTFLPEALESVASQEDDGLEVIAIDDGSGDDTVPILRSYSERLSLRVIEQEHVGNWVAGTNRGLHLATGRYVSFLHQDDVWMPQRMRAIRDALAEEAPLALLIHPVWFVDAAGKRIGRWRCPLPAGSVLAPDGVIERLLVQNFISIPGTVFPRQLAVEVGGMDEDLWYTADWDLWLRIARRGPTLYVSKMLAGFRVHPGAITAIRSARPDAFRWQLETVLDRHLAEWSAPSSSRREVEAAARFSVEANVALAALTHRRPSHVTALLARFVRLGPSGWKRYLRDSRILERAGARLRAGMGRRRRRVAG